MINISVSSTDFARVSKRFGQKSDRMKKVIQDIITDSLFVLEKFLKIASPVRTGRLRASITEGKEIGNAFGSIGPTVIYAKFVARKNPFMKLGAEASVPEIKGVIKDRIQEALNV